MTDGSGIDRWTDHQSAFDRVRAVARTVTQPRSASWIADHAHVTEPTAQTHLQQLVDLTVLQPTHDDPTRYVPDPLYTRFQAIRDLLDEHDREELHHLRTTIRDQLDTIQSNYDASSPDALREHAAHTETASDTRTLRDAANEWDTLRYRHTLVETALEHVSSDDSHCSTGN